MEDLIKHYIPLLELSKEVFLNTAFNMPATTIGEQHLKTYLDEFILKMRNLQDSFDKFRGFK